MSIKFIIIIKYHVLLIPYVFYRSTYFSQLRLQQCILKNVQVNTGPIDPGRNSAPMRVI